MSKDDSKPPAKDESASDSSSTASAESSSPPALVGTLETIDGAIGVLEQVFLALCLAALILLGTYQFVFSRFGSMNDTWPFEVLRYLVFFLAMGGATLAAQRGRMITMDFVARMLSPRNRTILRIGTSCFVIFVCILLYRGGMFARDAAAAEKYEVIPPGTALLALPVGAALIALHYVFHIVIDISYLAAGQVPPEEEAPSGH